MKKNTSLILASLNIGLILTLSIIFSIYLFIGPFDDSTVVKMIFRFNNNLYNVYALIAGSSVFFGIFTFFYLNGLRITAGVKDYSYGSIMRVFMASGKNTKSETKKSLIKKILLAFIIGWFTDLFHESFVATPILVFIILWYAWTLRSSKK